MPSLPNPTTPQAVTPAIRKLCQIIDHNQEPIFVAVNTALDAEVDECYKNVDAIVAANGGSKQHGWTIWELAGVFIEAEFHCVWRNKDGILIDISPRPGGETSILFLPDTSQVYSGRPIPNRRKELVDDPLVRKWIQTRNQIDEEMRRTYKDGRFTIPQYLYQLAEVQGNQLIAKYGKQAPAQLG